MTPDQINQYLFIFMLIIPSLVMLGGVIYIAVTVTPIILKTAQQLGDNNAELTKVSKQNSEQIGNLKSSLGGIMPELVKQTGAFEEQTKAIKTQGFDFKSYQSLVSDGLHTQTQQLEANIAKTEANTAAINALRTTFENFPQQIIEAISDKALCAPLLSEFAALRADVSRAMFQQQARATGTIPAIKIDTPSPALPLTNGTADEKKA